MSNRMITISREFGSGGRTIGRETAQKLGIPCYDVVRRSLHPGLPLDHPEKGHPGSGGKKSCVIVGRCADYILGDTHDCLKVFIHADLQKRAKRIVQVYGEREESPEKRLRDKDKRRKAYYRFYTDTEWGVAQNYHIALDSGVLGIETCVKLIADLY